MSQKRRVLMVCLGNSCRSPIAEAVFKDQIKKLQLQEKWETDSAALLKYHIGKDPEPRADAVLKKNGINNYSHKARLFRENDFYIFDLIFGMDNYIIQELMLIRPEDSKAKIDLLGRYDPKGETIIRDPYFDEGAEGFEKAFQQASRSIEYFLHNYDYAESTLKQA